MCFDAPDIARAVPKCRAGFVAASYGPLPSLSACDRRGYRQRKRVPQGAYRHACTHRKWRTACPILKQFVPNPSKMARQGVNW